MLAALYVFFNPDPRYKRTALLPLENISLAISDGDDATPRGTVGLLGKLNGRLDSDGVLLARHIRSSKTHKLMNRWAEKNGYRCVLVDKRDGFYKVSKGETIERSAA